MTPSYPCLPSLILLRSQPSLQPTLPVPNGSHLELLLRIKQSQYYLMSDQYHRALGLISRQVSLQAFEKYVLNSSAHRQELFRAIREVETQGLPRFNVWRMLLELLPFAGTWEDKRIALETSRKRWSTAKEQSRTGVKGPLAKQSPMPKNPLMKNMVKTEKKEVDSDPFLNEEIKKDVDRTYQQMQFFQEPCILKLLTSVLFVWCKLNPDTSYKQGMNEILASIVYVYFQEAIPADFETSNDTQSRFLFLNSLAYAEADVFAVFQRVMVIQKEMFKESLDGKVRGQMNPNSKNNSPILQRISQIQDHKLKALDLELFRILKLQDVRTKTFLLRWIRCIHTREFGLIGSLPIWDSILLDAFESPNSRRRHQFEFIDAMCLAMFIYMRALVFTRETANQIQQIYQKYPQLQGNDLRQLIALAWSLTEELRKTHAQNNNANWFEDTGRQKDLGLMDKRRDTVYRSKLGEKKVDMTKFDEFDKEDALYPDLEVKQVDPPKPKQETKVEERTSPKSHQLSADKPHDKSVDPNKMEKSPCKVTREIIFQFQELRHIIDNLKRSIALNDDIQSRGLANQALKSLEERLGK